MQLHEAERRARRSRRARRPPGGQRLQVFAAALATATTREEVGAAFVHEAVAALGADAAFLVDAGNGTSA